MRFYTLWGGVIVLAALVGCSGTIAPNMEGQDSQTTTFAKQGLEAIKSIGQKRAAPPDPFKLFSRALIDSSEVPVILARIEKSESYGTFFPNQSLKGVETWRTIDNVAFSFRKGIIVSSRGLGGDLMSADVRDAVSGLARAGDEGIRIHDYLDGEDQVIRRSLYCTYRSKGLDGIVIFDLIYTLNHVVETCKTPTQTIANEYWGRPDGGMYRQSRQWLGPDIGYVFVQQLTR